MAFVIILSQMSSINQQALVKRIQVPALQPLLESSRYAQLRLAKKIYNNRHIRDIKRFLREEQQILRKSKEAPEERRVVTETNQKKGRYDENELKQFSYEFDSIKAKYVVDIDPSLFINNDMQSRRRGESIKKRLTQLPKQALKRRPSIFGHHSALPFNRMKSISLSSKKQKQSPRHKQVLSPLRLRNRTLNPNSDSMQPKIILKQSEIKAALAHLTNLTKSLPQTHAIARQKIFQLIEAKYKLGPQQKKNLNFSNLITTLNQSSPKPSELPQTKFHIELPYCEFINLKQSRKSVQRIFNMSLKTAQRISFKIYDRNDNGIIDEKDIIQLFTVAESFSSMQDDMEVIVKNYKVHTQDDFGQDSPRSKSKSRFPKRFNTYGDQSDFSLDKLVSMDVIQEQKMKQSPSNAFRKSKFFIFKQTKQQFIKKKVANSAAVSLTWSDFQLAFKSQRPQIYYDLLDFLFNINSVEIYERANKQKMEQDKKSYRIMIFNNSDGKSEVGSVYNSKIQNQESTSRRLRVGSQKTDIKKSSKLSKVREGPEKEKQSIDQLIDKVKLIQQFEPVRY